MSRYLTIVVALIALTLAACGEDTKGNQNSSNNTSNNTNNTNTNNTNNTNGGNNTDPCIAAACGDLVCVVQDDIARCECPAGTHLEGETCMEDTVCQPSTCNTHGECSVLTDGSLHCTCQTGYSGDNCETCDTTNGWLADGQGGCTDDPCSLITCRFDQVCVADGTQAECTCEPGTHDDGGECVPDTTCMPNTCSGHGTCDDTNQAVSCVCDTGWADAFCNVCDAANDYHPDGLGGCTTDLCLPNPCTQPNQGICDASSGTAECSCDSGYHDEDGNCVIDQTCLPDSCSGNGVCTTPNGVINCQCNIGFVGDTCDACDVVNGYHDDGLGGCTTDPCLPNPCGDPNKGQCATNGQSFTCACDVGYHDDGAGGCTMDPCLPDLCAASNQACRDDGNGQPECYVPVCNDNNPCTDDVLTQGVCQYTNRADGASCSTSACQTGQTCSAGTCGGGAVLDCDDGNACTDDSCDVVSGCTHVSDDSNVPDDGVACTVDSCSGGFASYTPTNGLCDNSQYCDGLEVCSPADGSADANGCVVQNVPQPTGPGLGPCAYYVCDEANDTFTAQNRTSGSACNDGIYCTTGDVCDTAGQCRGTIQANCPADPTATTCTSTHPYGAIDLAFANLDLTITYEGQDPEVALPFGDFMIFAVEKETGAWVRIGTYNYNYGGPDKLRESAIILPGTYDILYTTSSANDYTYFGMTIYTTYAPDGIKYLDRDVTFYAGSNTYAVDVDPADVTVNITYEGADPEVALPFGDFMVFAVEKDTGAWVRIGTYNYNYGGADKLRESVRMMPGTYDILYTTSSANDYTYFGMTIYTTYAPDGIKYLQRNVIVGEATTLNIDVDPADVTVNITYEGADPEVALPFGDFMIFAVEKDTGAWVRIGTYNYNYGGPDKLRESVRMMPGTYDILYTTSSANDYTYFGMTIYTTYAPDGIKYLQRNVTVGEATTLNIDVDPADVTVNITYEGADPEVALPFGDFMIFAVEKDTGGWVRIGTYNYNYGGPDKLRESVRMMPGTYDILYTTSSANDYTYFGMTIYTTYAPDGIKYLQRNVTVGEATTLNIDVDPADVTVNITYEGADPEVALPFGDFMIFAVEKDTGAWVRIGTYNYNYGGPDKLRESVRMMPGTYDILYTTSSANDYTYFGMTIYTTYAPDGIKYLQRNVTVGEGTTLNIDVDPTNINTVITIDGADPEVALPFGDFMVFAVERDTGAWVRIGTYNYNYGGPDKLRESVRMMPGTYDILYSTSSANDYTYFGMTIYDTYAPDGIGYLDRCVAF